MKKVISDEDAASWLAIAKDVKETARIVADLDARITVMHQEMRETAALVRRVKLAQNSWRSDDAATDGPPPRRPEQIVGAIKRVFRCDR